MVVVSQSPMFMTMTQVQVIIRHFDPTLAPVTINREPIIYVANQSRMAVVQRFVVEPFRYEVIVVVAHRRMSPEFIYDLPCNGIFTGDSAAAPWRTMWQIQSVEIMFCSKILLENFDSSLNFLINLTGKVQEYCWRNSGRPLDARQKLLSALCPGSESN